MVDFKLQRKAIEPFDFSEDNGKPWKVIALYVNKKTQEPIYFYASREVSEGCEETIAIVPGKFDMNKIKFKGENDGNA